MRHVHLRAVVGAALLVAALAVAPASAQQPGSTPGGPWTQPNQDVSLSAIRDYGELVSTLEQLVARSHGTAELTYSPFHAKGSGRAIPIVTIGSGDRGIVIVANQHGDEFTVSNSAVELIRALTSNAAGAKAIRDAVTVTIMPRVNIDGFDATPIGEPWRHNVDPWCTTAPCPAFYALGRGYDINRYHSYLVSDPRDDPNTGPVAVGQGDNPVPEALAVRGAYDAAGGAAGVDVVMDLHHQGSKTDAEGQMVTGSTLWPNATETADALGIRPQFDDVVFRSKQVVSTLVEAVSHYGYANFSRYCGTTPPGISRNAYGLLGSASVLLEMRGDIGQKANGYIAKTAYVAAAAVIDALADGSLSDADVGVAEALRLTPGETGCPPAEEGDE
jgi:predicted deacylase